MPSPLVGPPEYLNVWSSETDEQFDPESATDVPSAPRRMWLKRLAFVSVAVIVIFAVVVGASSTLNVARRKSRGRAYVAGSHPAFVNYDALPVHRSLLGSPDLCDKEIVSQSCAILNQETTEYWKTRADHSLSEVHAMELSEALSISPASIKAFFLKLGLTDTDQESADSFAVSCQELCEAVVGAFEKKQLPKYSDVACIELPFQEPNCSVDVKPDTLKRVHFPGVSRKSGKEHYFETKAKMKANPVSKADNASMKKIENHDSKVLKPDQTFEVVRNAVARQFRIFARMKPVFSNGGDAGFEIFGPDEPKVGRRLNTGWYKETAEAAAKGQAYIRLALSHMNSQRIPEVVEKWFGRNTYNTRAEVKRVLNGIQQVLDNVNFIYPGDQCDPNTYAYVYPNPTYNKDLFSGKYLFYLCDYYMKVDEGEKIETMTHEGSHHETMLTEDESYYYPPDSQYYTMYGRHMCRYVADDCKKGVSDACTKVVRNADSLAYFINDAAEQFPAELTRAINDLPPATTPAPTAAPITLENSFNMFR